MSCAPLHALQGRREGQGTHRQEDGDGAGEATHSALLRLQRASLQHHTDTQFDSHSVKRGGH